MNASNLIWRFLELCFFYNLEILFTAYSLPIHCLMHCLFAAYALPMHCLFTAYSLSIHCLFTAFSLPIHCLFTVYSLPIHCLFTAYSLPIQVKVNDVQFGWWINPEYLDFMALLTEWLRARSRHYCGVYFFSLTSWTLARIFIIKDPARLAPWQWRSLIFEGGSSVIWVFTRQMGKGFILFGLTPVFRQIR
jgi:hypothetical protein